jgi:hypothetical protein
VAFKAAIADAPAPFRQHVRDAVALG